MNWVALAFLSSVATALFVVFGGAATRYMSATTMNAIQAAAMLATTLGVSCVAGSMSLQQLGDAARSKGLYLAALAGVSSGVAWLAFFAAERSAAEAQTGSSARVAAINSTYIALLAIATPLLRLGPPVTARQGAGIAFVLAGIVLVLSTQ